MMAGLLSRPRSMLPVFYDKDCDLSIIQQKTVAVIGYGNQGHAHALNLADSGVSVVVGLRPNSHNIAKVQKDGLAFADIVEAVKQADIIALLAPDETLAQIYTQIEMHIKPNATLVFAHGFCVHYGYIKPRTDLDVILIAPKSPGHTLRSQFVQGGGVVNFIGVHQNATGQALDIALSYACAIGGGRVGILHTTFKDETETDLFGEQAVLCGGAVALVRAGFDTLVAAGYAPQMAYFECVHELKLIADLIYAQGIAKMNLAISNNAEFGEYTTGTNIISKHSRQAMADTLSAIQSGAYAQKFMQDYAQGSPVLHAHRTAIEQDLIEIVGDSMRKMVHKN